MHLVMSPLEFMQQLTALVPGSRLHLVSTHRVLAASDKKHALVVAQRQDEPSDAPQPAECEADFAHHRPCG